MLRPVHIGFLFPPVLASLCTGCGSSEGGAPGVRIVRENPSDLPLPALPTELRAAFDRGDAAFEAVFRPAQGLGPVYIRQACASCHEDDAKGPGVVTKMVLVGADGLTPLEDQSALAYGHTVRPLSAGDATPVEPPEVASLKLSHRVGPAVFGRGYLEAILDSEIERVEAEQVARTDGISGRINRVTRNSEDNPDQRYHQHRRGGAGLIGRFGLKARIASVDDFTADAYQGDMGVTSPLRPVELPNPDALADDGRPGLDVDLDTLNDVADYVRMLAIPPRAEVPARGAELFDVVSCSGCHVPSMRTRPDHPIPALADVDAPIYSDLLLHDMGDQLSDGLVEGGASWREWRTAPLIGLRFMRNYLHDGRAETLEEAILEHEGTGSEANRSVEAFRTLPAADRAELLEFVASL